MKLSLPTHVPLRRLLPVLGCLLFIQVLEGTQLLTALEFGTFLLVSAAAFNAVGGLVYPSGSYIFFLVVLSAGGGGVTKTLLGEPLDSNVTNAQRSLLAYVACACSLWLAAYMASRLRAKRPWLAGFQLDHRVKQAALGSALIAQYGWLIIPLSMISTFSQINYFFPLAILMLVYSRTKETLGRQSFSPLAFVVWAYSTVVWGILAFSKQGMFTPSLVWAIGALAAGYRTTLKKLILVGALATASAAILTPVSQMGRIYRNKPESTQMAWNLLTHPLETRQQYQEYERGETLRGGGFSWFNERQGFLDRLTMFPIDDALMQITDNGHVLGFFPIETRLANMIPRYFLSGEKPIYHWGNTYAHELGMLSKADNSTGVSFSPVSDAYHCLKWWGYVVALPLFLVMFLVCDSLTGSTEQTIWATFYIMLFSHAAPEGMLTTTFAAVTTYAVAVAMAALVSRYFLPYVGGLLLPPKRVPATAPAASVAWQASAAHRPSA